MKAFIYTKYGSPDVLELKDIQRPVPNDDQVLVKIKAASVNPLDWHFLRGQPFFIRFMAGFPRPKQQILGVDIAGRVEEVGKNVKELRPGDEVFGGGKLGGFAEYACKNETSLLIKPPNLTFEEAASVPVAALTALQALQIGNIRSGQKVLINGASGGVGTFAVQIAKSYGADVTGVCSARNLEMVRSIGADHVIDYTSLDFTNNRERYDFILDNNASRSILRVPRLLGSNGCYVMVGANRMTLFLEIFLLGPLVSKWSGKKIKSMMTKSNKEDLLFLKELLQSGKIKSVIDRTYPFEKIPDAIRYLEQGHARGKVVITF